MRAARRELSTAKETVADLEKKIEGLHRRVLSEQIQNRSVLEKQDQLDDPIGMHRSQIVMALLVDKTPESIGLQSSSVIMSGDWPWSRQGFGELLGEKGFKPGSDTPDILVLGEIGFNEEYIVSYIENAINEDRQLKIYTQELFITWLATGIDPLEEWSEEDLLAAVKGHAAMEFVFKQADLEWPVVNQMDSDSEIYVVDFSGWSNETPLKKYGYNAKAGDLTLAQRRAKLEDFISASLTNLISSDEERRIWGLPSSKQRIYSTAKHLVWLIGFQGSDKPEAAKKWRDDLNWLKKTYYDSRRYSFYWPRVKGG